MIGVALIAIASTMSHHYVICKHKFGMTKSTVLNCDVFTRPKFPTEMEELSSVKEPSVRGAYVSKRLNAPSYTAL
jgi:hypothetical protein